MIRSVALSLGPHNRYGHRAYVGIVVKAVR